MSWLDSLTSAQKVVLALAVVVLLLGVWVGGGRGALPATQPAPAELIAPEPAATKVMVHVVGAVQRPGVYELPAGTRVLDAVNAAGGFAPEAERDSVNLAAFCEDGQQVRVEAVPASASIAASPVASPAPSVTPARPATPPTPSQPPASSYRAPQPASQADVPPFLVGAQPQPPVRINHAGLDELQRLPGIGPELARRIIYYRAEHGPFRSFSELDNVEGIGPATIAEIRACATLR
jgi:competence protein ComEA